ncbi:MAG: hypothetical protein ACRELD_09365 [Longimicrobiales bacterium]
MKWYRIFLALPVLAVLACGDPTVPRPDPEEEEEEEPRTGLVLPPAGTIG